MILVVIHVHLNLHGFRQNAFNVIVCSLDWMVLHFDDVAHLSGHLGIRSSHLSPEEGNHGKTTSN